MTIKEYPCDYIISLKKHKFFKTKFVENRKIKHRFNCLNSLDSWRKKYKFSNNYSSNTLLNLKFSNKSLIFLLKQVNVIVNNLNINTPLLEYYFKNGNTAFFKNDAFVQNNCINNFFLFIIHKNYFFFVPLSFKFNSSHIVFSKNSASLSLDGRSSLVNLLNFSLLKIIQSWFKKIIKSCFNLNFIKLKYKGKNYRWHRKKKGLVLRFGHSHLVYSRKPTSVFLKKKGRMKIIFFGTNVELIYTFLRNLISWSPSNVYTGRGLRLSRQRLLRKAGKVSAYR